MAPQHSNIEIPNTLIDAIDGLPDAAFLVADDGTILAVNSAAATMFEYSRSQLIGSQVEELMPSSARSYHLEVRSSALADRRPRDFSSGRAFDCERRGGDRFRADIMLSPTEIGGVPMTWVSVRDLDRPSSLDANRQQVLDTFDAIGQMAASTFDLENDFPEVASRFNEIIPHDRMSVMLICEQTPQMFEVAFLSGEGIVGYEHGSIVPLADSVTGWVAKAREMTWFNVKDAKFAPPGMRRGFKDGIIEGCGVPLFDGDDVIGVMGIGTKDPDGFSEFQRGLIERLASHLSVAVVNQNMRTRLMNQSDEIEAISEIAKIVSSSPDLDSAFSAVSGLIEQQVPHDRLSIYSVDLEQSLITGVFSSGEVLPGFDKTTHRLPESGVQSFKEMFISGEPMLFDRDFIAKAAESQASFIPYRDAGYNWNLIVPLIVTQRPVGFISFGRKSKNRYSDDDIAIASRIGEQLAGSVANAFQRNRLQDEIAVEATLIEIGRVVGSTLDLKSTKEQLGPLMRDLITSNSVIVSSLTEDAQSLRINFIDYADIGPEPDFEEDTVHAIKGTTAEQILQTKRSIIVNVNTGEEFVSQYPSAGAAHTADGLVSVMNVPLIASETIFGFLTFRSTKRNAYSESDIETAEKIGAQLASSLAFSELNRRSALLEVERSTLASIVGLMGSATNLADVWPEFAELLTRILPFDHVSLVRIDIDAGEVESLFYGWPLEKQSYGREPGDTYLLNGTLAETLLSSREGVIFTFDSASSWRDEYPGSHPENVDNPFRTVLGVPLVWGGNVVAVLFVHSLLPNAYSPSELRLSERIAAQISGPVAGSILRKNEAVLSEERELLSAIGTHMGAATDLSEAWPEFANLLSGGIEADMVALVGINDDLETASVMIEHHLIEHDANDDFTGKKYDLAGTLTGTVYESRRSLISHKATAAELLEQFPGAKQTVTRLRYHSTLATPLTWGGRVVAVLYLNHREIEKYDSDDQELVERIAAQIDGPVAGSILRDAELDLATERKILADIGVLMTSGQPISEVFSQVAEEVMNLVEFDRIQLSEVDVNEQTFQHIATWSGPKWIPEYSSGQKRVPLRGTMMGRVIDQKAGMIYSYIDPAQLLSDFPGAPQTNTKIAARTTVSVPLIWGDEIVATLWMSRLGALPYTDEVLAVTERIATQISGPVAGSLLRERESSLERERMMLAKISEYVGAAESFSAVFDDFVQDITDFIHFDAVEFVEVDYIRNVVLRPMMHYRDGSEELYETISREFPLPGTMTEQVVNTSKSVVFNYSEMADAREQFPGSPTVNHNNSPRSSMMVPIKSSDQVEACLWFSRNDGIDYVAHDIEFAERIAAQIAGPVAGALIRERAAMLARERAALANIGELMIGAPDIGSVFSEFVGQMTQLLSFDALVFMEIDHTEQTVERRPVYLDPKMEHLYLFKPISIPLGGTVAQEVTSTRMGMLHRTEGNFKPRSKRPVAYIPRSSIMVPLLWGDEVVMTLWVARDSEKMFEEEDVALMERVASQIAGPVAGSIMNRRDLDIAEERRRREIAELKVTTLSELSETKSNFVSAMSHELRTPLTSIVAFSDILSRNPQSELADRDIKQIKVIQRNARRLEEMIDELLDLSRMESGKFEIFRSSFDFVSMIEECLESAGPQFEALSQTINCEMPYEVLPVNGDRGRLQQVVNNLLNNASKFSPEGTDIDLMVTEKNDWLTVAVQDNGPGIQGEDSIDLFEMFHRADNEETRRVPGTGIGLHISKRIVEEHGGEIDIKSRENGQGAVASFSVPTVVSIYI